MVTAQVRGRRLGLAGHANHETYSVLTRLPPDYRLSPPVARRALRVNFPHTVFLTETEQAEALDRLAAAGVAGGAVYDALVGLAALAHGLPLLTADRRAAGTYARLGVAVEPVSVE